MIDYEKILHELEEERRSAQYAFGDMVPAFYTLSLRRAIEAVKQCQIDAQDAEQMANNLTKG